MALGSKLRDWLDRRFTAAEVRGDDRRANRPPLSPFQRLLGAFIATAGAVSAVLGAAVTLVAGQLIFGGPDQTVKAGKSVVRDVQSIDFDAPENRWNILAYPDALGAAQADALEQSGHIVNHVALGFDRGAPLGQEWLDHGDAKRVAVVGGLAVLAGAAVAGRNEKNRALMPAMRAWQMRRLEALVGPGDRAMEVRANVNNGKPSFVVVTNVSRVPWNDVALTMASVDDVGLPETHQHGRVVRPGQSVAIEVDADSVAEINERLIEGTIRVGEAAVIYGIHDGVVGEVKHMDVVTPVPGVTLG